MRRLTGMASEPARDATALGRSIVDANAYLVLGTADEDGRPWVSPVYFAHDGYREFFWVSDPDARHSRNTALRREVSLVLYDSRQAIGRGRALYVDGIAEQLDGPERDGGLAVFSARSQAHGARAWTPEMVEPPARNRLYRARARAMWVVDGDDRRIPVEL